MRVLVTGGAGFIGAHVAQSLLDRGDEVVIVDCFSDYYDVSFKKKRVESLISRRCPVLEIDISDYEAMKEVFSKYKFDKVCHLAAQAGVRYSIENPFEYQKTNSLGTLNILELMKEFNVKDLVFASSSSVYGGNTKIPFSEEDRVDQPVSFYAATKKHKEMMAHTYHKLYGTNAFGLRFFTVYGPWGRPDMAYFKFSNLMTARKPIQVFNNGDHERDFTYITDIVSGVLLSLDKVKGFEVFNLGNSNTVTLMYFIQCIEKSLGMEAEKIMMPLQKGDVHKTYADNNKAKEILGWEPTTKIEEGLENFVIWYKDFKEKEMKEKKICIVGLGYVGIPLAVALAEHFPVTGFDIDEEKVKSLQNGIDPNGEYKNGELNHSNLRYSNNPEVISQSNFVIVCVPTPIDVTKKPDLEPLKKASEIIGKHLQSGSIVVYESTVYPGTTEDVCIPVLEEHSQLKFPQDFKVGYSPERLSPGDKLRGIKDIVKVVAASDVTSLEHVNFVYSKITQTHKAQNIKVAEASKITENIQRDLNIALMNELAIIYDKFDINIHEVLEAAGTKWNFHKYTPGLVGGHCIGIDPYYLTHKAEELGHHPDVILTGRRINDTMHKFYANKIVKRLNKKEKTNNHHKVLVLGLTFKANVNDYRNSRIKHLIQELQEYNVETLAFDPFLKREVIEGEFASKYFNPEENSLHDVDMILLGVEHTKFKDLEERGLFTAHNFVKLREL